MEPKLKKRHISEPGDTNDINLLNLIDSRITEIIQIEEEAKRKKPKLFAQRLPRFMRRRAACHNVNRLPCKIRLKPTASDPTKQSKKLLRYRRRLRFRKHKRCLKKHTRSSKSDDPLKCLIHKWFAKRFKLNKDGPLIHVPINNNTKNQRNLKRESTYGCCYVSMAHMIALELTLKPNPKYLLIDQLEKLNQLCLSSSGFTFCAYALEKGRYEVGVSLFDENKEPICDSLVFLNNYGDVRKPSILTMWVPRESRSIILEELERISKTCREPFSTQIIMPKDAFRVRFIGPNARREALKLCPTDQIEEHKKAIEETDERCKPQFKNLLGRHIKSGDDISFTYYNTNPRTVDLVFKGLNGKMSWHKLIKHKAHVVGGHRDYQVLCT